MLRDTETFLDITIIEEVRGSSKKRNFAFR